MTGTPTAPTAAAFNNSNQLATTAYVDAAVLAFDGKPDVQYCSTSALPANTYANGSSGVGATLTGTANGPLVIDGVTMLLAQVGTRILVAGESTSANNGWYTLTQQGTVAVSPYILTRDTLSDQAAEIGPGYLTSVIAGNAVTPGSANNGKVFISVCADPFTVGATALTFSQVGSTYSAGTGLTLSGTTFSINASYVGQTSITTLGTLTTGATGAGFTIALTTSTVTGTLPAANLPALTGAVTSSAGSATTSQIGAVEVSIPSTVSNVTVVLMSKAPFAGTINAFNGAATSAGTLTVAVKINGTNVTGLSAISVSSTPADTNASAANTFAVGDRITLVISSASSAADFEGTLKYTR
jgi:hypothetical protein